MSAAPSHRAIVHPLPARSEELGFGLRLSNLMNSENRCLLRSAAILSLRYPETSASLAGPWFDGQIPLKSPASAGWKMIFHVGYRALALDGDGKSSTRF